MTEATKPRSEETIEQGALSVVVADDVKMIQTATAAFLTRHGFNVVGMASSGEEAVQLALKHSPDVVLMDIDMPGMGGIAATAMLREQAPRTRVVGLSFCDDDAIIAKMIAAGAADHVFKGDIYGELVATIQRVTRQRLPDAGMPGNSGANTSLISD